MESKDKRWCVYIHTNKINNKAYIGITSRQPEERWGKNGSQYHNELVFKSAIKKYGWDNFEHVIFEDHLLENEAKHLEKLLIALFKTNCAKFYDPPYGYNLTDGGDGTCGYQHTDEAKKKMSDARQGVSPWNTGITFSEELKKKLSEAHIGKKQSPEQIEKTRQRMLEYWTHEENKLKISGENNPKTGTHLSEETKRKISVANKGKILTEEQRQILRNLRLGVATSDETRKKLRDKSALKRRVTQLTMDGKFVAEYDGLKIAQDITGIKYQNISACVRHKGSSAGGYLWMYSEEYNKDNVYEYGNNRERKIVQLTKEYKYIDEYSSISDASKKTGFSVSGIGEVCAGKHSFIFGYRFMYWEDYKKMLAEQKENLCNVLINEIEQND